MMSSLFMSDWPQGPKAPRSNLGNLGKKKKHGGFVWCVEGDIRITLLFVCSLFLFSSLWDTREVNFPKMRYETCSNPRIVSSNLEIERSCHCQIIY